MAEKASSRSSTIHVLRRIRESKYSENAVPMCHRADRYSRHTVTPMRYACSARPSRSQTMGARKSAWGKIFLAYMLCLHRLIPHCFDDISRFAHWNNAHEIAVGSPEYYGKMFYTRGTKCWNGPERNVVVSLFRSSHVFRLLSLSVIARLDMWHGECAYRCPRVGEMRVPVHGNFTGIVLAA